MKRIIIAILLLCTSITNARKYDCEHFSINIPDTWEVYENPVVSYKAFRPPGNSEGIVHFDIEKAPVLFGQYLTKEKNAITATGERLIVDTRKEINGQTAHIWLWSMTAPTGGTRTTFLTSRIKKGETLCTTTCIAPNHSFESIADTFGGIIDSIRIK